MLYTAVVRPPPQRQAPESLTPAALGSAAATAWKQLLRASLQPLRRPASTEITVTASVPLVGVRQAVVVLCVPAEVATAVAVGVLGLQEDELASGDIDDALGELVVAIGGGIRTLLSDVTRIGQPQVVHGAGLTTAIPGAQMTCEAGLHSVAGPVHVSVWRSRAARAD